MVVRALGFGLVGFVLGSCGEREHGLPPAEYNLPRAEYRLGKFASHLDEVSRINKDGGYELAHFVMYDGIYPPNTSEQWNGATRHLIAPEYRASPTTAYSHEERANLTGEEFMREPFFVGESNVFDARHQDWTIQYISNGDWYLLASCGPDRRYESEVLGRINRDKKTIAPDELRRRIAGISYDPTNGHDSRGDVTRTSF